MPLENKSLQAPGNDSTNTSNSIRLGQNRLLNLPGLEKTCEIYCPPATISAIDKYGIDIRETVKKAGMTFYLTNVTYNEEYPECLFYVLEDGVLYPRLAYKSNSAINWRVCPKIIQHPDDGRLMYSKGNHSYTMETMPFTELELAFDKVQKKSRGIKREIIIDQDPEVDSYAKEISLDETPASLINITTPHGKNYAPFQTGPSHEHFLNAIKPESTPDSFIPDFSKAPILTYEKLAERTVNGKIKVEVYRHNYEGVDYDFYIRPIGTNNASIVKIERSDPEDKMISSYGTRTKVSPFEPLCFKTKEYLSQCGALNGDRTWKNDEGDEIKADRSKPVEINILDDTYGSLIPLLNKIKIVQKYKAAKTLARENAKIQSKIRTLLGLAGAVGAFSLVCCAGATTFVLGSKLEESVSRGGWTERPSPDLPEGEAASKELQAAQAPAIFVITCGEYNGDPQSVSNASFIFNKGGYPESVPNDTSLSLFKGFEEVRPHPLTVCKNAEVGSTWQIPLKATR